jgi:hypothetical protein
LTSTGERAQRKALAADEPGDRSMTRAISPYRPNILFWN